MTEKNIERPASSPESYCATCDAPVGGCSHGGARYLSEIAYERAEGGWSVSEAEREMWDRLALRTYKIEPAHRSQPLDDLIAQLDVWVFMSDEMIERLSEAHAVNPERATRLVETLIRGASSGRLNVPDAWLRKKLREGIVQRPADLEESVVPERLQEGAP